MLQPALDRQLGRREIGTSRSLSPLPLRIRNGWPTRNAPRGKADQLARPQARAVEQFEKCEVAQRQRLAARRAGFGRFEHALRPRPRRGSRGSGRSSAGRGSAAEGSSLAEPIIHQEAEEAPQRRRTPRDRGRRKVRPCRAKPRSASLPALRQCPAKRLGGRVQIAAIGGERVAGKPRLGRHHVEEAIDERAVVESRHVRASASAAIIRAVILLAGPPQRRDRVGQMRRRDVARRSPPASRSR